MLFLFPQSLSHQALLPLLSPRPARNGINHLREHHYRAETARSLQMTSVYTREHMHTDTSMSPMSPSGIIPGTCHPALFWHKHSPPHPHLQHTYSVCVIEAVGWNYKLKVSAGEGRSNYSGFDVLLQQCMWGEWPPCLFSVKTQKVTQCTIRSLFTRQNMRHCHYELTQKYTFEKHAPWRTPGAYHPIHGHPHTDRHVHILGLWHLQTQRRIFHIIILKSTFRLCILHTWTLCDLHTHTH